MQFKQGLNHDHESDAVYLKLREGEYETGQELDDARHIDLDVSGNVLGIEFLYVSDSVDIEGVPVEILPEVNRLLQQANIKVREAA